MMEKMEVDEQPQGENIQSNIPESENPSKVQNDTASVGAYLLENGLQWQNGQLLDEDGNPVNVEIEEEPAQPQSKSFYFLFIFIILL